MKTQNVSIATEFVSFVLSNLRWSDIEKIEKIGVYFTGEKRLLLVGISPEEKELRDKLSNAYKKFYSAPRYELLKVLDDMQLVFSLLPYEKDIVDSAVLYLPSTAASRKVLIYWGSVKPNSKRVLLNKRLFGYVHLGKDYPGLLQKYGGEKLGSGCIIVPKQHAVLFFDIFAKMKIKVSSKEVSEL